MRFLMRLCPWGPREHVAWTVACDEVWGLRLARARGEDAQSSSQELGSFPSMGKACRTAQDSVQ